MKQYLINTVYKVPVLMWLKEQGLPTDYEWYPLFVARNGQEAFRVDILSAELETIFSLVWGDITEPFDI